MLNFYNVIRLKKILYKIFEYLRVCLMVLLKKSQTLDPKPSDLTVARSKGLGTWRAELVYVAKY